MKKPARRKPRTRASAFAPARSRGAAIAGGAARVAGFGILLYFGGFLWFVASRPGPAPIGEATDAVVVLTGGPGRLARGAEVLVAGSAKRMLISGVGVGVSRASLAASIPAPPKHFAQLVDLGYQAVDTRSNAVETTAWVGRHGYRSLRLVTSSAHMRRARLELALNLPPTVRIVEDGVPGGGPGGIAREFNKYLLRRAALALGGGVIAFVRSLVYAIVFYLGSVPIVLTAMLVGFVAPGAVIAVARVWAGWFALTTRVLLGIRWRVVGSVPDHATLVAIKHQSAYETIMVLWLFKRPAVVLKAELLGIPFWGAAARAHGVIPVDRAGSASALRAMLKAGNAAKAADRPVLIFPEGTRTLPGDTPELRAGLAGLYRALKLPLVPVALDSGRCWPKGFVKHAGVISFVVGAPIPAGLDRAEVEALVHTAINALNRP